MTLTTIVYRLRFSDQRDGCDYGLFSTEKKAMDYLTKVLGVQVQSETRYTLVTVLRSDSGLDYRIEKESVS